MILFKPFLSKYILGTNNKSFTVGCLPKTNFLWDYPQKQQLRGFLLSLECLQQPELLLWHTCLFVLEFVQDTLKPLSRAYQQSKNSLIYSLKSVT